MRGRRHLRRDGKFQPQAFPGRLAGGGSARDMARQGVGGTPALHGIPDQIAAGRPFCVGFGKSVGQPVEFVLLLERGIDQHQAAPLVRRHERRQRRPAVEIDHPRLAVAAQRVDQLPAGAGLDLAGRQAVLRPQQRPGDQGRSGIGLELPGALKALTMSR